MLITVCHIATQADFFIYFSETALGQMNGAMVTKRVSKTGVGKLFDTVSLKWGRVAVAAGDGWRERSIYNGTCRNAIQPFHD